MRSDLANATLAVAAFGEFAVPALLADQRRAAGRDQPADVPARPGSRSGAAVRAPRAVYGDRGDDPGDRPVRQLGPDDLVLLLLEPPLPPRPGDRAAPAARLVHAAARAGPPAERGGAEVLVEAEQVRPGDRVVVSAGEAVPVDGRVVRGEAVVDERSLRGTDGATRKRPGDAVLAGSFVLSGEIVVVGRTRGRADPRRGDRPRPGRGDQPRSRARRPRPATPRRSPNAPSAPTLATAGLGLLVGDLNAVGAILRPDYATGPGPGRPARRPARRRRLRPPRRDRPRPRRCSSASAEVDLVVLDDHPALGRVPAWRSRASSPAAPRPRSSVTPPAPSCTSTTPAPRRCATPAVPRSIHLLDLPPIDLTAGVTVRHGGLTCGSASRRRAAGEAGPLARRGRRRGGRRHLVPRGDTARRRPGWCAGSARRGRPGSRWSPSGRPARSRGWPRRSA